MEKKFRMQIQVAICIFAIFGLMFFAKQALAYYYCRVPPKSYAGRTVTSCKSVESSTYYWQGTMTTKVITGNALSLLGWASWTDTRFCAGQPDAFYDLGAYDAYSSKSISSTSQGHLVHPVGLPICSGVIEARVFGKHHWQQVGYSPIEDAWDQWQFIP
ncbi:MAG TPA: hypothetical protein PLX14_14735 [Anaerolineales bacterium]|nr:hypothetical protein [Anaerolineales bacterium]